MRIGIDIDGVLTDIEQWQLDVGGKYFSAKGKKFKIQMDTKLVKFLM